MVKFGFAITGLLIVAILVMCGYDLTEDRAKEIRVALDKRNLESALRADLIFWHCFLNHQHNYIRLFN